MRDYLPVHPRNPSPVWGRLMFYSTRLSLVAWSKEWLFPILASFTSFLLLWAAHPPRHSPESAYLFLLPVLIWFHFRPNVRKTFLCILIAGWIYQIMMVGWMRHISLGGMLAATLLLSCFQCIWFLVARAWIGRIDILAFPKRFLVIVGLSSLWVLIEWARTLFTLGFPWCPLSVTQWERPVLLQSAWYGGGWTISFFLIFFNLCTASYLHHLLLRRHQAKGFLHRSICPDLYIAVLLLLLMVYPYFKDNPHSQPEPSREMRIGICQPYLKDKWMEGKATEHKQTLIRQTEFLALMKPDIILWPEASTPYPVNLDTLWVEGLAKKTGIPILAGSVVREEDASYNAMVYIDPIEGFNPEWYAKQILVPFGEYVPWPFNYIPGLEKLVGPVGNFSAGHHSFLMDLPIREGNARSSVRAGFMICYEDIFPAIPRKMVEQGAELLIVSTNDAWFMEEGCAEQHAAHSVLRAVETKVPVIRCGNAGWSGWIDENGIVRDILLDDRKSVYFQGAKVVDVRVPSDNSIKAASLGDGFAYFCAFIFFSIAGYFRYKH